MKPFFSVIPPEKILTSSPTHYQAITALTYEENNIYSSGNDGIVQSLSLPSLQRVIPPLVHESGVSNFCVQSDLAKLFSLTDNKIVRSWSLRTQEILAKDALPYWSQAITCDKNRLYIGDSDGNLHLYSFDLVLQESLKPRDASIYQLTVTPHYLVIAYSDKEVLILDKNSLQIKTQLHLVKWNIINRLVQKPGITMTCDERYLYVSPYSSLIMIYLLEPPFNLITRLKKHKNAVLSLTVNNQYLLSGSADQTIILWDKSKQFKPIYVSPKHGNAVTATSLTQNYLITGTGGGVLRVIDINTKRRITKLAETNKMITSIDVTDDLMVTGSEYGTLRVVPLHSNHILVHNTIHEGYILTIAMTHDYLYTAGLDGKISTWKRDQNTLNFIHVATKHVHFDAINQITIHDDDLYTASSDSIIYVLSLPDLTIKTKITDHTDKVRAIALDEMYLYSGGSGKELFIHDKKTLSLRKRLKHSKGTIRDIKPVNNHVTIVNDYGELLVYSKSHDFSLVKSVRVTKNQLRKIMHVEPFILLMGLDPNIYVYDTKHYSIKGVIKTSLPGIRDAAQTQNDLYLAGLNNHIYYWNKHYLLTRLQKLTRQTSSISKVQE